MSISNNISKKISEVIGDKTGDAADQISDQAFEALFAGITSTEWETFMKNFADAQKPEQLARLTLQDSKAQDPAVRKTLVYLAASSMCGADTIMNIPKYVFVEILDKTLDCGAQPNANPQPAPGGAGDPND